MDFSIETFVSNLIDRQFPQFYREEGENFILFMRAYYEWMEQNSPSKNEVSGGPINEARKLFDYRDIDNTIEMFLEFFQKKYLYGIPFRVIANKRFLLKHILDVYRSKGSIQCYRLLFKLIYDQDVEVYLPGKDILKSSDGTWVEPKFLELTDSSVSQSYIGKTIIGLNSKTTAVVESFINETYDENIINKMYISNILPKGGTFEIGEIVIPYGSENDDDVISAAPSINGSLNNLRIINGGQGFSVGDVLKIAHKDNDTNEIISYGIDGLIRVSSLVRGIGFVIFELLNGGFGFNSNSSVFVYRNIKDYTGSGASFKVDQITNTKTVIYNKDIICDFSNVYLNSVSFGLTGNNSANLSTPLVDSLSFTSQLFGTIFSLNNIKTGNQYSLPANAFVRSTMESDFSLQGTIVYDTVNMAVHSVYYTGTATDFSNSDTIEIVNTDGGTNAQINISTNNSGGDLSFTFVTHGNNFVNTSSIINVTSPYGNGVTFFYTLAPYVTGTGTIFDSIFANDDVVSLQSNALNDSTKDLIMIRGVVNSTLMTLYDFPSSNSTALATYKAAPVILPANFDLNEQVMFRLDETINGKNENILVTPQTGNDIVGETKLVSSGIGYKENEQIKAYIFGTVSNVNIIQGGTNYSNGEYLAFYGGNPVQEAKGYVSTNSSGGINSVSITYKGAGYVSIPEIKIQTNDGYGAILEVVISDLDYSSEVTGAVVKSAIGRERGYWSTTRGFLDSDKYIQDSYYYQDFSYELKVAQTLSRYKDIIYNTFHPSGSELFGKYLFTSKQFSNLEILEETEYKYADITCDSSEYTCDNDTVNINPLNIINYVYVSETNITSDVDTLTVDKYFI